MFDLALPRDIDPRIGSLPNVRLYDIDRLGGRLIDGEDRKKLARIEEIINEGLGEYERWSRMRTLIPKINEISALACADVEGRLSGSLKHAGLGEDSLKLVREAAGKALSKVVESMLLSLYKEEGEALPTGLLSEMKKTSLMSSADAKKGGPLRFPLFVDLSGRKAAVIGAGSVALRRITALLAYPCRIIATAPEAREEILALRDQGKLDYVRKEYESSDLDGAYLVIAATDSRAVNRRVAEDARRAGIFCSAADCREDCTFYFPATVRYDGGVIGICGTGENHGQTRQIAAEIREFIKAKEASLFNRKE
jgi:glutamyl-tRNA reductase